MSTYCPPTFRPILEGIPANGAVALAFGKDTPQDTGEDNWVEASDHGAFYRAQVPFLYLGVNYHPDYHRPSDDFEKITPSVFFSATELSIASFRALDRALDRMATRSTYSAAGRVYSELLALADGRDHIVPAPQVTTLALSANTTRETASRAIAVLIRRGIVSREDGQMQIHAPRMLADMVV